MIKLTEHSGSKSCRYGVNIYTEDNNTPFMRQLAHSKISAFIAVLHFQNNKKCRRHATHTEDSKCEMFLSVDKAKSDFSIRIK